MKEQPRVEAPMSTTPLPTKTIPDSTPVHWNPVHRDRQQRHLPRRPRPARVADRLLGCQHEVLCVELAAARSWEAFACGACTDFTPLTPAARAEDVRGLLRLAGEVCRNAGIAVRDTRP